MPSLKKIEFKEIYIKNFLSIGNTPIILKFTPGINIITGVNLDKEDSKNGCGKSSIIAAIYFALTGEPIKDLKKDELVNWVNKKNCEVTLEFSIQEDKIINYKIVRTISPNSLSLYREQEDITLSSMPKTTDFILKLLNINTEILKHIILTSSNSTLPFMQLKKVEKRKFIEGILQLEVLGEVASYINKEYNQLSKDKDLKTVKKDELIKSLNIQTEQMSKYESLKKNKIQEYQNQIDVNNKTINKIKSNLVDINNSDIVELTKLIKNKESVYEVYRNQINQLNIEQRVESNNLNNLKSKISEYNDINCPVCKREFDASTTADINSKKQYIQSSIDQSISKQSELNNKINDITLQINNLSIDIQKYKEQLNAKNLIITNNQNIQSQINYYNHSNSQILSNIEATQKESIDFDTIIHNISNDINIVSNDIDILKNKIHVTDISKYIMSEEGIKSKIVKTALDVLNNKINYYLSEFNTEYQCRFNEYFEDEFTNGNGQICNYNNLSGGESKRIDFAILFAFNDLRRIIAGNIINLVTFDEIFDSAIDNSGINNIIKILTERVSKYNECIYIVTHKKELAKSINDVNIIEVEKRNGFSYISIPKE